MTYSIYDPRSGIILSRVNNPNQLVGRDYVTGNYQPGEYYVRRDQVKKLPEKPAAQEHVEFNWDLATESWQYDEQRTEQAARRARQDLFKFVDRVSPMWYASMTPEQQAEVTAYRQAILDLTDQLGWPRVIAYPRKPAWL